MTRKTVLIVIGILLSIMVVSLVSYAYFGSFIKDINNNVNVNIISGDGQTSEFYATNASYNLIVNADSMVQDAANNYTASDNTTLNVTLKANTIGTSISCMYDIAFSYDNTSNVYGLDPTPVTTGATNELTLHITGPNTGTNFYSTETNFAYESPKWSSTYTTTLVSGAVITDNTLVGTTQNWNFENRFYNLNLDQSALANKTFSGRFFVTNVNCRPNANFLASYIINNASTLNGNDPVGNNPWSVEHSFVNNGTLDAGYRFIGKNPNNYVKYNDEMWRIIGVENTEYCADETCSYTTSIPLVKIVKNSALGGLTFDFKQNGVGSSTSDTNASNDWTDAQAMMLLNETKYYKSGYYGTTLLHDDYSLDGNDVLDSNNIIIYKNMGAYFDSSITPYPPEETSTSGFVGTSTSINNWKVLNKKAQNIIAPVKWNLYGKNNVTSSFGFLYRVERNIDNTGNVYNSRATHWYGKVGLMYPSDYGLATSGGNTYNRADCIAAAVQSWSDGDYANDCAFNDWILYAASTSTSVGSKTHQRLITPGSSSAVQTYTINKTGRLHLVQASFKQYTIRPTLYLQPYVSLVGNHSGSYSDPYIIN